MDEQGRPSFEALQNRRRQGMRIAYYAFDVLHRDGGETLAMPLEDRTAMLPTLIDGSGVRISETLDAHADAVVEAVRAMGLEGVIAKRRRSRYEPGQRSGAWVKFKLEQQQELVIGGYRPSTLGVDALLVGYYVGRTLRFAAKVRAGMTPHVRRQLAERCNGCTRSGAHSPICRAAGRHIGAAASPLSRWTRCNGCGRRSLRRSDSWSGHPMGIFDMRGSWAFVTTNRPARSCGKGMGNSERAEATFHAREE